MAKSKRSVLKKKVSFLTNDFLVIRSALGLLLISLGVILLAPLKEEGDVSKLLLVLIYGVVITLWGVLVGEFILKTMRLQDSKAKKYSAIVSINSLFGLFIPIFVGRFLLNKVMYDFLGSLSHTGSTLCQLRSEIIGYYRFLQIDSLLSNLSFWVLVLAIVLFLFGGVIERSSKR